MSSISVYLETANLEISTLAERLGGICTKERPIKYGIEQIFEFDLESFANQFHLSALHFPEVISIGRSPNQVQEAIASSRLCDCGWTTKQDCNIQCNALPIGLEVGSDRDD